jgi:hypothetical protein
MEAGGRAMHGAIAKGGSFAHPCALTAPALPCALGLLRGAFALLRRPDWLLPIGRPF